MLHDLQARMSASLLEEFKAPAPRGLIAGDPARAAARFMIHRGNVLESLVNALGHTYPAIKSICGDDNFRVLAGSFVRTHPPARPELMAYGGEFAAYAAGYAAALADFPFLPDLARLEWAVHQAYFAPDEPALTPEMLAAVPPEHLAAMELRLHCSAHVIASAEHPIHTIWASVIHDDGARPDRLPEGGEAVLVLRSSGPVEAFRLDAGEAVFLGAVAAGAPLEKTLAAAEAVPGSDPPAALAAALTRGAFSAEVSFNTTSVGGVS